MPLNKIGSFGGGAPLSKAQNSIKKNRAKKPGNKI